ncbi:MAG: hypothetical protein DWQ01_06310 [Planctomycetota bacterium]|nr:MAG: hypothetical protein DWQ01_06310 [Planctomycetota bacterium]
MGPEGIFVVLLTVLVLVVLVLEKASLDAIGIGLLIVLVASGEALRLLIPDFDPETQFITLQQALSQVGNYAVITIAGLYVVGEGLNKTGAVEFLARWVLHSSKGSEKRMVLLVGLIAASVSSVLNNTGVVVVFIPVLMGMAKKTGIPASRLLIPLSFASILGGMCTLVGTSTNLLVSGAAKNLGKEPISMFEMTPLGLPLTLVGIGFMALFARRLLPERTSITSMMESTDHREYVTELVIGPKSPMLGKKYGDAFRTVRADLLFFVRGDELFQEDFDDVIIQHGDVVMLRGGVDELADLQTKLGLKFIQDMKFDPKTMQFFELAVAPHSVFIGHKVGDLRLHRDFGLLPLAVLRDGHHIRVRASEIVLRPGDLLLVIGGEESRGKIRASSDFYLLTGADQQVVLRDRARRALAIAAGVVVLFSLYSVFHVKLIPLPMAALLGAMMMVATGCVTARRAYRSIDWPILIFVVGTLALGKAMDQSGAAGFFAGGIVEALQGFGPAAVVSGLIFLCILFNALISHSAVAVLLTPIAVDAAEKMAVNMGLDMNGTTYSVLLRSFILAIAFGGSICFATPIGHQTNLMVYGPGGYRYSDFLRLGLPLSLIAWIIVSLGIPLMTGLGFG